MVKRACPAFPGILDKPILKPLMFPFGEVPGDTDKEREIAYKKRLITLRFEKLSALLEHYGISASEKDRWLLLAWHLACDCVPGMQVADRLPRRARPRERWGLELRYQFCDEIDAVRKARPRASISAAINIARARYPDKWGKYKATTLETRYHELKKKRHASVATPPMGMLIGKLFAAS